MSRELIKPEKKAGRPKGSRTALTAKVIDDILRHWKKNGANALNEMFEKVNFDSIIFRIIFSSVGPMVFLEKSQADPLAISKSSSCWPTGPNLFSTGFNFIATRT